MSAQVETTPRRGAHVLESHRKWRPDAVTVLTVVLALLVCLPSRLILAPLGAAGTPATVVSILALLWWFFTPSASALSADAGRQPVRTAIAFFGLVLLAAYLSAAMRPLEAVEARAADRFMIMFVGWCGLALVAADRIPSGERLEALIDRIVLFGGLLAGFGLVQFATGVDVAQHVHVPGLVENHPIESIQIRSGFRRVAGTALHPIEFGVVLATVLPLALRQVLVRRRHRDRLAVLLIAFALPMSLSRSAVLGSAAALLVLSSGWTWRRRGNALAILLFLLGTQRALVPGLLGTIKSLFLYISVDPSTTGRTDDYAVVWEYVQERPVFGRGAGTFVPEVYRILDNQYLVTLIEAGMLGLLGLLTVLVVAICCARRGRRRSEDDASRELGLALAASVSVSLLSFVTFDALSFPMATGVLFLVIGCCGAFWRLQDRRSWSG